MDIYLSEKLYARKLTAWIYFKMQKLSLTFVFLARKGYVLGIPIYDLILVNWHGQTYPSQQNAQEITL